MAQQNMGAKIFVPVLLALCITAGMVAKSYFLKKIST